MKKLAVVIASMVVAAMLAGCLEIDLSRVNGNQKDDGTSDTVETTE